MTTKELAALADSFQVEHRPGRRGRIYVVVYDHHGTTVLRDSISYAASDRDMPWRDTTVAEDAERCARYGAACFIAGQMAAAEKATVH